jgi:predicted dienelactone hydrolase
MKRAAVSSLLAVTTLAGCVVPAATATAAQEDEPRPTEFAVGVTKQTYEDAGREVDVTVYYPAAGRATTLEVTDAPRATKWAPYPLILFSHELGLKATTYVPLLHTWVAQGYVVAIPTYEPPTRSRRDDDGQVVVDVADRVSDATFVLDRMLDRVQGGFGRIVDQRRIGAVGHALGAIITLVVGYNTEVRDPRIDAVVTFAGGFGGDETGYFEDIDTPLLAIHGDADATDPIEGSETAFALANPPKYFITLVDGEHTAPYVTPGEPAYRVVQRATLDFFAAYLEGRASAIRQLQRDGKVKGVATIESRPG